MPVASSLSTSHVTPEAGSAGPQHARAKEAAQEFEAVFLAQVLRGLGAGLRGEGPLGGGEADPYRGMLTDAYARAIARAGGVGIADAVLRELVRAQEIE